MGLLFLMMGGLDKSYNNSISTMSEWVGALEIGLLCASQVLKGFD